MSPKRLGRGMTKIAAHIISAALPDLAIQFCKGVGTSCSPRHQGLDGFHSFPKEAVRYRLPSPRQGTLRHFFQACADHQLEGIVSTLASSKYRSGRSKTWLKTKCFTEGSFVIIGTDRDRKTGAPRALLAKASAQGLAYAGAAFFAVPRCSASLFDFSTWGGLTRRGKGR